MGLHPRWTLVVTMKRSNMARALGTQSAPNLGHSRIPSVSRAISAICHRRRDSPLQVEFVGGSTRWRFVEDDFNESESDSQPKTRRVRPSNTSASRSSSQACLHEVTIAAGWGQKSEREKRMEKLTSKLGYTPGLPRQRGDLAGCYRCYLPWGERSRDIEQ